MMGSTRAICPQWLRSISNSGSSGLPPLFLCPVLRLRPLGLSIPGAVPARHHKPPTWDGQRRFLTTQPSATTSGEVSVPLDRPTLKGSLPPQCPGCGAFSQTSNADLPGFFDLSRSSTKRYLGLAVEEPRRVRDDDRAVQEALRHVDRTALDRLGVDLDGLWPEPGQPESGGKDTAQPVKTQIVCARCHDLIHHNSGTPIYHPSVDSIRETMAESPYKYNHVCHVIDAADFPMSLLPRIHTLLDIMPFRSRNRRARHEKFYSNHKTEMSFVITRSDLFAPRKEQVDKLMPWITTTLRDALGRAGRNVRLGNVRCVSARRGWWIKELKEEIWERGGATWMVGKANVGKSYLFQHVFPKGRMAWASPDNSSEIPGRVLGNGTPVSGQVGSTAEHNPRFELDSDDESALLPPARLETEYPPMPVVSALPGTTASPIRIPFGNGKGELIDLPGLSRSGLIEYIDAQHQQSLVMKSRIQPEQTVLKGPWHSLLLGGLIRITPRTKDLVFLTYNFTPLEEHRTLTDKAVGIQEQTSDLKVENIAVPGTGQTIELAGSFELRYDVTKQRTGPITRRDAANISIDHLPYRVVAIDILIEGCGWVEVVAQVRTKDLFGERKRDKSGENGEVLQTLNLSEGGTEPRKPDRATLQTLDLSEPEANRQEMRDQTPEPHWPIIDVYSPRGQFIGSRRPLNAWMLCRPKTTVRARGRPRRSMKGAKKRAKAGQLAPADTHMSEAWR